MTITGTGFGQNQGSSTVTFNGTVATPTSWSNTRIVAPVPEDATSGPVVVTVATRASNNDKRFDVTDTDEPVTNTISASPNPCTITEDEDVDCAVTIEWAWGDSNINAVQVWVSHNGAAEGHFASSSSRSRKASQVATWIQGAPHTYTFNLYDKRTPPPSGTPLDSVVVTARDSEANPEPLGYIWAYPDPCKIETGDTDCTSSIGWTSRNTSAVRIWKSQNGGTLTPFTTTDSLWGKEDARNIGLAPDDRYTFSVHDHSSGSRGAALDSVTVEGKQDPTLVIEPSGTITPSATSCEIASGKNTCSVTLGWTTKQTIRVKLLKGAETLDDSTEHMGSVTATIKQGDNDFMLKSYTSGDAPPVILHRVTIRGTTTSPTDPLPDPPSIASFTASPTSVDLGEQSTLSWSVSGATGLEIDQGVGSVTPLTSGSKEVTPDESKVTTTYKLTASDTSDEDTTDTASVTINAPSCDSFTAAPALIDPGGSSKLTWSTTSAKSVSINQGVGSVAVDGNTTVSPSSRTTYTLTATGSVSPPATCMVTVTVRPRIDKFEADPASITRGQGSTLEWGTTNASTVTLDGSSVNDDGSRRVVPYNTASYTLRASNSDAAVSKTVTVTVSLPPAPSISSLSRTQGPVDSQVTIYGSNFSTTQGSVSFGGSSAEINSWGNTSVSVLVPRHLSQGQVSVSLTVLGQTSNSVNFWVTGNPLKDDPEDCDEEEEDCEEDEEEDEDDGEESADP